MGVASGAHALHDGYTDLIYIMLPIWQAEFGLSYAVLGLLRSVLVGPMASLQIPAGFAAERFGAAIRNLPSSKSIGVSGLIHALNCCGVNSCWKASRQALQTGGVVAMRKRGLSPTSAPGVGTVQAAPPLF